jgi:hypothetical protein
MSKGNPRHDGTDLQSRASWREYISEEVTTEKDTKCSSLFTKFKHILMAASEYPNSPVWITKPCMI